MYFLKEKVKVVIKQVKNWNWEIIRKIIAVILMLWGYYALCELNCERLGGEWNSDKKICRR